MIDPILASPAPVSGPANAATTSADGAPFESMLAALAGVTMEPTPPVVMQDESGGEDGNEGASTESEQGSTTPQLAATLGDQITASRMGVMALLSDSEATAPTDPIEPPVQTPSGSEGQESVAEDSLNRAPAAPADQSPIEPEPAVGETRPRVVGISTNPEPTDELHVLTESEPSAETGAGDRMALGRAVRDYRQPGPDLRPAPNDRPIQTGGSDAPQISMLQAITGPTLAGAQQVVPARQPSNPAPATPPNDLAPAIVLDSASQEGTRQADNLVRSPIGEPAGLTDPRIDHAPANTEDRPDLAPGRLAGGQEAARVEVRPQAGRMAERIESWIKTTENAPPPRSITLRGAELHGLTIRVSVVHDGLSIQLEGTKGDDVAWMRQVIQNLGDKGFDISEFAEYDSEGERRQLWDEEQADRRRRRPDFDPFLEEQLS